MLYGLTDCLLKAIWEEVRSWYIANSQKFIVPGKQVTLPKKERGHVVGENTTKEPYLYQMGFVSFPPSQSININMMPFILGDITTLPQKYRHYWPLITACNIPLVEKKKVGYLTIHESYVAPSTTQRRGGLHIEAPGFFFKDPFLQFSSSQTWYEINWGGGQWKEKKTGGIYVATTLANSSRAWNAKIPSGGLVEPGGDIEHLRWLMPEGEKLQANTLYWMTDRTPHECLPMGEKGAHRQFFRLVAGDISVWYSAHSTANELGTQPKAKIIQDTKFEPDGRVRRPEPTLEYKVKAEPTNKSKSWG
jgi:hypothetical protein